MSLQNVPIWTLGVPFPVLEDKSCCLLHIIVHAGCRKITADMKLQQALLRRTRHYYVANELHMNCKSLMCLSAPKDTDEGNW